MAPYLQALGISHAYLSPYFKARAGSTHGYDIFDHRQLNPELGDDAAFTRMCAALTQHALGQILDFVPNHMGVGGADNPLWLDVLEWGADAAHAGWFDIDWDPERRYLHNKILVPVLGDQYGIELERGMLRLQFDASEGSFAVWAYGTHKLPICPVDYSRILGDTNPELERLGDAFAHLPEWRPRIAARAAGMPVTQTPGKEIPLEIVTRSTGIPDPLPVEGSSVNFGDVETTLGHAISTAAVPWADAHRAASGRWPTATSGAVAEAGSQPKSWAR